MSWPVQYRVSGPDISQVREIALELAKVVATSPQATMVHFDWIEPARQVRIRVDQDEARLLGLSSQALASVLNTVISGTAVTQVRDDIYLVDVVVRATDEQRVSVDTLRTVQVPLPSGRTVPLSQFATFEYQQEYPLIWRRDRVPTLTVQANVVPGVLPEAVVQALAPAIEKFSQTLPRSYRVAVGGTVEESQKSLASVMAVVPVMLLIMITVLMFQLHSFQRLLLGSQRRAARLDRRGRRLADLPERARLCRHPGRARPDRHDHQECRDPDRSDRRRTSAGQKRMGRGGRRQQRALPSDHADGRLDGARHDSDRADGFLGTDGLCHHGRIAGRHPADAGVPAHALRGLVRFPRSQIVQPDNASCTARLNAHPPHIGTTCTETSMRLKAFDGPAHVPASGDAFSCSRATATEMCSLPTSLLLVGSKPCQPAPGM